MTKSDYEIFVRNKMYIEGSDYIDRPIEYYSVEVKLEMIGNWEALHGESFLDYHGSDIQVNNFAGYMMSKYPSKSKYILEALNDPLGTEPQEIEHACISEYHELETEEDRVKIWDTFYGHLCDYVNLTTVTKAKLLYSLNYIETKTELDL